MNKKISVFILFFIFISSGSVFSQTGAAPKFKPAPITVDVLFSYSQPLPNMFGNIQDFFDFKNYGVKFGIGSEIDVKLSTNKKGNIKPYASIAYNLFLGSDGSNTFIDSNTITQIYPLPGSKKTYSGSPIAGTSKMYLHDFSFAGGFEYDFINKTRWTPFLGAELSMNVLFGTYRQTPNGYYTSSGYINSSPGETSFTIKSATRFGFGAAAGITFRVHQFVGFTFAAKYKFANVLGKSSKVTNGPTDLNKINLDDKSAPDLNSYLNNDRNIDYFQFLLGVSFFVGKR